MKLISRVFAHIDWMLVGSAVLVCVLGIVTMHSSVRHISLHIRQLMWLGISLCVFFVASTIDWRFLRRTQSVMFVYVMSVSFLLLLFIVGSVFKGAKSWFDLGFVAFQPVDVAKLAVILVLSKYFSRRHIEIAHISHIILSGLYVGVIFLLVFLQPDFGSAMIIFFVWFGMVFVSGISKKHLIAVVLLCVVSFGLLWGFVFKPYQKARIMTFINPLTDIRGAGYNAYQSVIAVGSGQLFGKGIGYGTQSKLEFLPEYETDFIFAAFAEEWGFVGVIILFILYTIIISRVLSIASKGSSNFEMLFGIGVALLFIAHATIHIGMNIGVLPVTGNTLPFMSYGGSHLVNEFLAIGILSGMNKYNRSVHKDVASNEMVGVGD